MLHYENDDYECAADPFCPPPFPISDESDYMPGYDDGAYDADEVDEDESENQPPLHKLSSDQDYYNYIDTIDQAFHDRAQTPPPV